MDTNKDSTSSLPFISLQTPDAVIFKKRVCTELSKYTSDHNIESLGDYVLLMIANKRSREDVYSSLKNFVSEEDDISKFFVWLENYDKNEKVVETPPQVREPPKEKPVVKSDKKEVVQDTKKAQDKSIPVPNKSVKRKLEENKKDNEPPTKKRRIILLNRSSQRNETLKEILNKPLSSGRRKHPNMTWVRQE